MNVFDLDLTESQRMMREACRKFVDDTITPFVLKNWKNEWNMTPEERLPNSILQEADSLGIRTLGVPEEYGGMSIEKEVRMTMSKLIKNLLYHCSLTFPVPGGP